MLRFFIAGILLTLVHAYAKNENIKGDVTTLYTPNVYGYQYFGLEMLERDFLVFSVRACSDIHVALMQLRMQNVSTFNITEVVIGGWYNTKSVYRNGVIGDQRHYLDVDTPNIAHCAEFRTFWISWGSNRLRTGTGPIPGEQTFMELHRTNDMAHYIRFVAFSTGYGVTGVWKLEENQGYYLAVLTPDDFRYEYVWKTTDYKNNQFHFYVMGCHDIHINLSPQMGTVYYEAVLGGWNNTMSVIRVHNTHMLEYYETGIVACNQWRAFWISWTDAIIRVGKGGELFKNTFMEWQDPNFAGINHLSFSCGYGSSCIWGFNDDLENAFKYYTQSEMISTSQSFNIFLSTVDKEYTTFEIQACSDAWLTLSSFPGDAEEMAQQIYIGIENNTKSGVRTGFSANPIVEVQTQDLLSCDNPRAFWVSWGGGQRQVGTGTIVGFSVFLTWTDDGSNLVTAVGFANAHQSGANYLVRRNAGDGLFVLTPSLHSYHSMWQSVIQDVMFIFRVRACRDVYVAMSGILGVAYNETYELILGSCYMSIIHDTSQVYNPIAEASTPDVLSCTHFRSFWISWFGGYIKVGKGSFYGRDLILELPDVKPHPINAISVSTNNVEGLWEFETDTGDELVILTPNNHGNMKWLHLHSWVHWFHFKVQGSGARLVLSDKYRDASNAYHIDIGSKRNTELAIYRVSTLVKSFTESNIIRTGEFEDFWLSWKSGRIQLGKTKYRTNLPLVDYQDPQPIPVKAVGFHGGSDSYGEWKVSSNIATELSVWTERYQSYETWLSLKHRTSVVFALQSCSNAEILLSAATLMWLDNDYVYRIVLQGPGDMTTIWSGNQDKKLSERHTPDLLSCNEEKHFWVSWYSGHICLGHGHTKGSNMIVSYQDLNPPPVLAFAFSGFEVAGGWRLPLHTDSLLSLSAPETSDSLSGGEIAGIVIGSILMIALFVFMAFVILVGPDNVFNKFRNKTPSTTSTATVSFDNPLSSTEFSEISMA